MVKSILELYPEEFIQYFSKVGILSLISTGLEGKKVVFLKNFQHPSNKKIIEKIMAKNNLRFDIDENDFIPIPKISIISTSAREKIDDNLKSKLIILDFKVPPLI